MSVFEHSFSLIGLVLGLTLVEVLSTFIKTVRSRGMSGVGLLTPLLAIFIILDVTTFWGIVFENREILSLIWPTLGIGIVLSSAYYLAATMAFPLREGEWQDLDEYFMRQRRLILGLMFAIFTVVVVVQVLIGRSFSTATIALDTAYLAMLLVTGLVSSRKACVAGLSGLIMVDTLAFVLW